MLANKLEEEMSSRPPYDLYEVTAKRCILVSPNMKRLTIDCSNIPTIRPTLPGQWLKVFVTDDKTGESVGRAYTVRNYCSDTHELDLDFYLHGDTGPVGAWAMRASAGDVFEVSDLRSRSGTDVNSTSGVYVLFGDETALPAISAILEALPNEREARAFISIGSLEDEVKLSSSVKHSIVWLHRTNGLSGRLLEELNKIDLDFGDDAHYWIAGESAEVKAMRAVLKERGISASLVEASGYWKQGQADHRGE